MSDDEKKVEILDAITEPIVKGVVAQIEKEKAEKELIASCEEDPSVPKDQIQPENMSEHSEHAGKSHSERVLKEKVEQEFQDFSWDNKKESECENKEEKSEKFDPFKPDERLSHELQMEGYVMQRLYEFSQKLKVLEDKDKQRLYGSNFRECPMPSFPHPSVAGYKDLDSSHDFKLVDYNFPKIKFSGKPGTTDVHMFMTLLKSAQEFCPVHPNDFKRILLNRLAPPALGMVYGWFSLPNADLRGVLNRLYDSFASNIAPEDARNAMKKFQVPKGTKFQEYLAELEYLGGFAARGGATPSENSLLVSLLMQEGLEHGLPEGAYKLCFNKICEVREDRGREPQMEEITAALSKIKREVDFEMRTAKHYVWGRDRDPFMISMKITTMTPKGKTEKTFSKIHMMNVNKVSANKGQPSKGKSSNGQQGQKKTDVKGKSQDKKVNYQVKSNSRMHCSFCNQRNHHCASPCYAIKDDNLKQYEGPPAQEPCKHCVKAFDVELTHPVKMCPIRDIMMKYYAEGKVTPVGLFKEYYERSKKKSNHK